MSTCSFPKKKLILALLLLMSMPLMAAQSKERPKAEKDSVFFHGSFVGSDLVSDALFFSGGGALNIHLDANLRNRVCPCLEFGWSRPSLEKAAATCQSQGFFGKIGVNLPLAYYGPNAENHFFVGARLAFAAFNYDLSQIPFDGGYWGDGYTSTFLNERSSAQWLELTGGMRMQVAGPVSLGWTVRLKKILHTKDGEHSIAPVIPGYGVFKDGFSNVSLGFSVYYHLPF